MSALVADCVGKSYGARRVLSSASLRAVAGQVRVLFGRNGSGKSTLLRIATGRLRADTGVVFVGGDAMLDPTPAALARRGVFFLPDHDILSPTLTLGAQLRLYEARFGQGSAREAAEFTGIAHLIDRSPVQFSGGETRRAELALAIARGATCLVADEPYRGIAPADHDMLTRLFRALAARGCAVVLTGHEVMALGAVADHITWCASGTTLELGTPAEASAHERFRREYLGPGYNFCINDSNRGSART